MRAARLALRRVLVGVEGLARADQQVQGMAQGRCHHVRSQTAQHLAGREWLDHSFSVEQRRAATPLSGARKASNGPNALLLLLFWRFLIQGALAAAAAAAAAAATVAAVVVAAILLLLLLHTWISTLAQARSATTAFGRRVRPRLDERYGTTRYGASMGGRNSARSSRSVRSSTIGS